MIDNDTLKAVKEVPLPRLLADFGIRPVREKDLAHDHLSYTASYRNEKTPSLSVFRSHSGQWLYKDHATNETGTNIDLLVRFGFFSDWRAAAAFVANKCLGVHVDCPSSDVHRKDSHLQKEHPVTQPHGLVQEILPIIGSPAEQYIVNIRRIPISVASQFVCFVRYSYTPGGKIFSGIAWPTIRGGWSIRWPKDIGKGKGKAFVGPGGPSYFPIVQWHQTPSCLVFEGIMDFLSLIVLTGGDQRTDAVVLNSADNVHEAKKIMAKYKTVHCYLDNDEAGKNATKEIITAFANAFDHAPEYAPHNDLNDYLKNKIANEH